MIIRSITTLPSKPTPGGSPTSSRPHAASSVRPGGMYILGLRFLPSDVDQEDIQLWTGWRGATKVTVRLRALRVDFRRRIENVRVCLLVCRRSNELHLQHQFQLRTYTAR